MTHEDRDMLLSLRRQQSDLQHMLERLTAQLRTLEVRAGFHEAPLLPPIPPEAFLPPIPVHPPADLPPIPVAEAAPAWPPLPPIPAAAAARRPSFESIFGRWLTRLGSAFLVLSIIFLANWALHQPIGAAGKTGLIGLLGVGAMILGQRQERWPGGASRFFGGAFFYIGFALLYVAFYAAGKWTDCASCRARSSPASCCSGGPITAWRWPRGATRRASASWP
ncbi:MAG: hypothetical protein WDO13_09240 [Verrucomicrobiota bacterium]